MSNFHELSITELQAGLQAKDFTAGELREHFLNRINAHQDLNAFISTCEESSSDFAGGQPLSGIPIALKDLILTKGHTTTCASKFLKNFVPPYDATVATKLKQNGAVIIGKNNLDEFAMGSSNENSSYGPVKNPWNPERVPGGSSGGGAAAVAAGLVPAALGSDTGGSIRQPCSFTGTTGIKPTYGRVSRYGVIAYASSLDQIGTMARNVRDAATVLNAIAGKDPLDATSMDIETPDFTAKLGQEIKGLRVGVPKEYFIDGLQAEVKQGVEQAIRQLESLGAEIVEISLPHTEYALPCYYIIAPAEASSNLSRYDGIRYGERSAEPESLLDVYCKSRSQGFGLEVKRRILIGTYVLSAGYYDAYYLKAQKVRRLVKEDFTKAFAEHCDVIAAPVAPTTAFRIGENTADPVQMYLQDIFTIPASLAGLPGMSVPCGFDNQNLPIGLHLIGAAWQEQTLLQVAHAYQESTDWHKKTCFDLLS